MTPLPSKVQDHILSLLSVSNPLRQAAQEAHSRLFKPLALVHPQEARRMLSTQRSAIAQPSNTFSSAALCPEMNPRFQRLLADASSQAPCQDHVEDQSSCANHGHWLRSQKMVGIFSIFHLSVPGGKFGDSSPRNPRKSWGKIPANSGEQSPQIAGGNPHK